MKTKNNLLILITVTLGLCFVVPLLLDYYTTQFLGRYATVAEMIVLILITIVGMFIVIVDFFRKKSSEESRQVDSN